MTLGHGHQNSFIFFPEGYIEANEGSNFKVVKESDPFICRCLQVRYL